MQEVPFRFRAGMRPAAAAAALLSTLIAGAAHGQVSAALARSAVQVSPQAATTPVSATVWLQLHNKAALDAAVKAMYTPGSPTFRKFAGVEDLKQFAPTVAEVESVKKELAAHNLSVLAVDANNLSVRIQGKTSDFESAFHTSVSSYRMKSGKSVTALVSAPALSGGATGLVASVTGVGSKGMQPYTALPLNPDTGKPLAPIKVTSKASPQGMYYSPECFYAPKTINLNTAGGLPEALYTGVGYGASTSNTTPGTVAPCGYAPQDVYSLYKLNTIYGLGYTGKGQTIAIVDAYGSPTINEDLATFNQIYGLPAATATSFKVLTPVPVTGTDSGWAGETTLDVEWSHAIAPDANIVLVAAPTNSDSDLQNSVLYIIENKLANIISNSYGQGEYFADLQTVTSWDELCELGAFEGVSVNFSSGDDGDFLAAEGQIDVSLPADSPYATGVGGTSVAFSPVDGSTVQFGWGTNITRLSTPTAVSDPPVVEGFEFGAGGGTSIFFNLPNYQSAIGGSGRQVPDVSAIADPYTGVEIIETMDGAQYFEAIGGTSLASPVFSAEWALIQQRLGGALGQAAPYIAAEANTAAITDILPLSSPYSVQGGIADAKGVTYYSSIALGGSQSGSPFLGALYHGGSGSYYDLTFGTDSSLPVTKGWDPVTGWGSLDLPAIFNLYPGPATK